MNRSQRPSPAASTLAAANGQKRSTRAKTNSEAEVEDLDVQSEILKEIVSLKSEVKSCNETINILREENLCLKENLLALREEFKLFIGDVKSKSVQDSLKEIKNIIKKDNKPSYADQLKNNEPEIVIFPKKNQDAETTSSDIKQSISPTKINIDTVRKTFNGGVIVKCKNKESSEKLKAAAAEKLGDKYEVRMTTIRNPRFKVINISEKMSDKDIVLKIKNQNEHVPDDANLSVIKIFERKLDKGTSYSAVIETDPEVFRQIIKSDKLSIGWDRCKVYEHIYVSRCYRCLGYNHIAKVCTRKQACIRCGGEHEFKDCMSDSEKCINCLTAASKLNLHLDVNHRATSMECSILQRKLERERERTQTYNK